MELYLIRHGQSHNNTLPDAAGRLCDPPLTATGEAQAVRVAAHLAALSGSFADQEYPQASTNTFGYQIGMLFCSPMLRALQTTVPIAKALGVTAQVWIDVHEQYGIWLDEGDGRGPTGRPGMSREEIEDRFPDYDLPDEIGGSGWWNRPPETEAQWQARATRVAEALWDRFGESEVRAGIVGHGGFTNELLHELLGRNSLPGVYFSHQNTAISRLDFEGDGAIRVRYLNRLNHLPPELVT